MKRNTQEDLRKLATAFFKVFFGYFFELDNNYFGKLDLDVASDYPFFLWVEEETLRSIEWKPEKDNPKNGLDVYTEQQLKYARDLYYKKLIPYLEELWIEGNKKQVNP